jgi:hypothetical protein
MLLSHACRWNHGFRIAASLPGKRQGGERRDSPPLLLAFFGVSLSFLLQEEIKGNVLKPVFVS